MAITRLSNSGIATGGVLKYDSMLAGNAAYVPTSFESIATATGTGSSGTITFSSIPSTFQHLQIRFNVLNTSTAASFLRYQLNGDTGANYAIHRMDGDGSAINSTGATGITYGQLSLGTPDTTSPYVGIMDILDYASTTKQKTTRAFAGRDTNGGGNIAITKILT